MSDLYSCFVRTWYVREAGKIVPGPGRKSRRGHPQNCSLEQARTYCRQFNATNEPGRLSRKAEFESL